MNAVVTSPEPRLDTARGRTARVARPRLSPSDVLRVGGAGMRARPLRVVLSALGISIGIAAMVAVVGLSASSRAALDRQLAALGTNLLTVEPGQSMFGDDAVLPESAAAMIGRIGPVESVTSVATVGSGVYRSDRIPTEQTKGLSVKAVDLSLPEVLAAKVVSGTWLNQATARYPAAVLGATAARRLGIDHVDSRVVIDAAGRPLSVVGILAPMPLAPELDAGVLVGWPVAMSAYDLDPNASTIYTRVRDDQVEAVRAVLAATANPEATTEVNVSRPSDALDAREATDATLTGLLLGLGAVALIVGGVGVANTMVISVLERRSEIGLRRSLGATRGQIRLQFLVEALLVSGIGGVAGVCLGSLVTWGYAHWKDWFVVVPWWAVVGGVAVTLAMGVVAGLYPAARAARVSPTEALAG
jgi:putative ABC transport system permease protein